ncbi:MAG: FprA family A-type flavoprotein [Phycisphaerae bacterium]|nr:FprA family A-type flavoprotein [Phycisphaerae bacterium]
MDRGVNITDHIVWVGVNDYETHLFEALWPLPRGISYNAYLVRDEKVALIDTVKEAFIGELLGKIDRHTGGRGLDYLVVNHMEPDHSGAVAVLRRLYPEMQIVGNAKTAEFLKEFFGVTEGIHVVADGDTLSLGTHTLQFHLTPMVHWPETMMTYATPGKVLFSGDAFGGFGALPGGIFDDEVDTEDYYDETLRYFTNIVAKFARPTSKAIAKLADVDVGVVAATHGPVWRSDPKAIIERYDRWARGPAERGAVIVFGSMYANTERMARAVGRGLAAAGVEQVRVHNASRTHPSYILNDLWLYRGYVLGTPTYNTQMLPTMEDVLRRAAALPVADRVCGVFGTYGWSGGGVKAVRAAAEDAGWRLVEPVVEARCAPSDADLDACGKLGANLATALDGDSGGC